MIALTDVVRHVRALEAANDPDRLMDEATERFGKMARLTRAGEHEAARNESTAIGDLCLRLCVGPSTTERDAENKHRFLAIMIRWAWLREPALGAALEAARRTEELMWSGVP